MKLTPLATLGLVALAGLPAPAQNQSDATIQVLITEIRQLRLALEKSAIVAPKIQVTLQRVQLQQDTVHRLQRQLEDHRDQLAKATKEELTMAAHAKSLEEHLSQEQEPARRKQIEEELKHIRPLAEKTEQQRMHDQQQRQRESDLAAKLQMEQSKLDELNDKLTSLERLLDPPPNR
jgi:translation initiation factor 2B subunit (eIF-2B alpha/beta/delta family)